MSMTPATVAALQAELLDWARKYHEATTGGPGDPMYAGAMMRLAAKVWAASERLLEVEREAAREAAKWAVSDPTRTPVDAPIPIAKPAPEQTAPERIAVNFYFGPDGTDCAPRLANATDLAGTIPIATRVTYARADIVSALESELAKAHDEYDALNRERDERVRDLSTARADLARVEGELEKAVALLKLARPFVCSGTPNVGYGPLLPNIDAAIEEARERAGKKEGGSK